MAFIKNPMTDSDDRLLKDIHNDLESRTGDAFDSVDLKINNSNLHKMGSKTHYSMPTGYAKDYLWSRRIGNMVEFRGLIYNYTGSKSVDICTLGTNFAPSDNIYGVGVYGNEGKRITISTSGKVSTGGFAQGTFIGFNIVYFLD